MLIRVKNEKKLHYHYSSGVKGENIILFKE